MRKLVHISLAVTASLMVTGTAWAQQTTKLFDAVNITLSGPGPYTSPDDATPFASKQLYLACGAGATATISGPLVNDGLIVDNFIQVQGPTDVMTNYCPNIGTKGCFDGTSVDPKLALGLPAESAYTPVGPQDISSSLVQGLGLYTINLMDWGYTYASSQLTLTTSCAIKDQVCHYDNGKKQFKTLTVGAAAIPAHLAHGDTLGACH